MTEEIGQLLGQPISGQNNEPRTFQLQSSSQFSRPQRSGVRCGGAGIYLPTVTINIFSPPHPETDEYHIQSHRQHVRGKDDREVKLQIQY